MPIINSYTTGIASFTPSRYSAGYQIAEVEGSASTSKTLSFSAVSSSTESINRLFVFILGIDFSSSGSISSVTYGGNSCTRAIGTSSASDRSSTEIWSVVLTTNPATNSLVVTSGSNMVKVGAAREILLGMTNTSAYNTDVVKGGSDSAVQVIVDHPANGVTLLGSVLWWGGSSAGTCLWPVGSATKSGQVFGGSGDEFGFSSAYYDNTAVDSNREFGTNWSGPGSPNQEVCGASWR